ncbi:response regulator receiver domain protein [Sphingobacterium spiritivorum ATCC 33300]|uniref:Mycobacterial persistence regulator A n=2 Tax=Sphingobacterium spiritivorum TaxID=258 RepID=A0A380CIH7_SPHSI|nr:response regulator transcription factor [Sphingobacterium spiritivorum]EEI92440.1 response regulator receiver domain protein [Sphingobacterium spiritivorum ATCC 33300]QQS96814.1 response regulator transcription factor [Sphingobacterium spiritivorum]SUJ21151.1 Mycobacterial persistence regulator A [Sphingobacterium spiritivorum]
MEILLVEDDSAVVSLIRRGLSELNFNISVALNGLTGLEMAVSGSYDLIILDVMLPGMDGLRVCRNIRQQKKNVPILILSALDQPEDIVDGFKSDADDYLTKPFNMEELKARVSRFSRKIGQTSKVEENSNLEFADLTLDYSSKIAKRQDVDIALTATEFRLLEFLMKNQKRVVSRIDILESVWGMDFNLSTNVVDVYINYLRNKIDKGYNKKLLHTVVGMGYVLRDIDEIKN